MKTLTCCAALISLLGLLACSAPQPQMDMAQVRTAIEENNAKFSAAFSEGDMAALSALYTEDAMIMPPNSERVTGRTAIQEAFSGLRNMGFSNLNLTTDEIIGSGDFVSEVGSYTINLPGGAQDSGKYLVFWKKDADGHWKLHRDIWNSSLPLPGMVPAEAN
jgi:ketosteroid isomerase-like protein